MIVAESTEANSSTLIGGGVDRQSSDDNPIRQVTSISNEVQTGRGEGKNPEKTKSIDNKISMVSLTVLHYYSTSLLSLLCYSSLMKQPSSYNYST